ncbi:MAG: MoaD/ThiS family protein [Thermodesulfobacteriota bacterium]|nr:MoaD/ThiS family protein [Thermodesulfobacteriota bacterium]
MVISVQFHGTQRKLTRTSEIRVPVHEDCRVSDVFVHVKNRYPDLLLSQEDVWVSVNNLMSTMNQILNPDDRITFLPHIGGG